MNITVDLSAPERTPFGKILQLFYYCCNRNNKAKEYEELCELAPGRTGLPHNGGSHTLSISGKETDVMAWLKLFKETIPSASTEINLLLRKIKTSDNKHYALKKLTRRTPDGELCYWFSEKAQFDSEDRIKEILRVM